MLRNSKKKRNVEQLLTNQQLGGPLSTSTRGQAQVGTKVTGEKRYESWTRGRRSKDSFEILNHDKDYITWKSSFEAELEHQKLDYVERKDYDPSLYTCSFDQALYKEQKMVLMDSSS